MNGENIVFARCIQEDQFTYARSVMLLFILPIAFNATTNNCNSDNEVIIYFFEPFPPFNFILYFFLFLELFDKNIQEKLFLSAVCAKSIAECAS